MKHAAIYVRVSTGHQVDKCSLPFQKKEIKAYLQHVLHIDKYEIYEDAGKSAKNTKRPAFERMMNDIKAGKVSHVVVYKIDRISRNLVDFSIMHEEFKRYGTTFISLNEQFDTSSAMGAAMMKIILVFAELERSVTSERVSDIMKDRATQGKWNGANVPLGYKWSKEKQFPVPDETEAERVRMIYDMYDKGMRTPSITRYLNDNNIPTKRNGHWTTKTVADTLRNPFYKGTLRYNYRKSAHGEIKPEEEWIIVENNHDALIEPALWERVNASMDTSTATQRMKGMPHAAKRIHVFGRIVKCSSCDCVMHSDVDRLRRNGFKPSTYVCPNRKSYQCTEAYISDVTIGPFVFNYVRNMLQVTAKAKRLQSKDELERMLLSGTPFEHVLGLSDDTLNQLWGLLHSTHSNVYYAPISSQELPVANVDVKSLKDKGERLKRALQRLKDAYLYSDDGMSEKEYLETKTDIETQLVAVNNDILSAQQSNVSAEDFDFMEKASALLLSHCLNASAEIDYQELWLATGADILCDVAHSMINDIYAHDGKIISITFKNGMTHKFVWKE